MALSDYKTAQEDKAFSSAQAQSAGVKEDHSTGLSTSKNTSREHKEAASFRFTSGSLFDVYAPNVTVASQNVALQAKDTTLESYSTRLSGRFAWIRTDDTFTVQSKDKYSYVYGSEYKAAGSLTEVASSRTQYSDSLKIQVGQHKDPVSDLPLDGTYGKAEVTVQDSLLLESTDNQISLKSKDKTSVTAGDSIQLKTSKSFIVASKTSNNLTTKGDTTCISSGNLFVSAQGRMTFTTGGPVMMMGSVIYLGGSAGRARKAPFRLDKLKPSFAASVVSALGNPAKLASSVLDKLSSLQGVLSLDLSSYTDILGAAASVISSKVPAVGSILSAVSSIPSVDSLLSKIPGIPSVAQEALSAATSKLPLPATPKTFPFIEALEEYETSEVAGSKPSISNNVVVEQPSIK